MRQLGYVRVFSTLLFLLLYTGGWGFSHVSTDEFCSANQPNIFSAVRSPVHLTFHSTSRGADECRFEARSYARDLMLFPTNSTDLFSLVAIQKLANFNLATDAYPIHYYTSRHRIHSGPIYLINESFLI
jgi:hypothetical protein